MTVNNMINNGFYAKSETFGGNGRRTPLWHGTHRDMCTGLVSYRTGQDGRREFETSELFCTGVFYNEILIGGDEQCSQGRIL